MSRPARYGGKSYSEKSAYNQNGGGAGDTVAASALTKAHAQYNEPLAQLQAIFSDWKEDDLLSILEDTRGDVETAVARISEGHAEQWGAVKHKKDKKIPAPRERERDRDGHVHSSPRGANSPRGRGRGGRGGNSRSGTPREHRERSTNGASSTPATAWGPEPGTLATNGVAQEPVLDSTRTDEWDAAGQDVVKESLGTELEPEVMEDSLESHPPLVEETKLTPAPVATPGTSKSRKIPVSSGMSWAQIAKPQAKPLTPVPPLKAAIPHVPEPLPQQQQQDQHAALLVTETGREAPTTVEAPSFDEEPASTEPPASQEAPADDWVNIPTPTAETETDVRAQHLVEQPQEESLSQTAVPEPPVEPVVIPAAPEPSDPVPISQSRQEAPETIAPPPGLASPAVSHHSASTPKSSTPSNSRPSYAARLSSRWKPDQAVLLPPTVGLGKTLPLQFGSLNLSEDSEPQSHEPAPTQELQPLEQRQVAQTLSTQPTDGHQNIPSASPARSFRAQAQPEAPVASPEITGPPGISHTQAPPVNPSLALAPGPSPTFSQQQQPPQQAQSTASQHTLAGLTHAPQLPGQQSSLGHGQQQSFSQQSSFPQHQQQYESGGGIGISGTPLSGLAQPSQSQNQGFFRQTESPFYNQNQSQIPDHGFGNATGGFNQGPQAGFSGGPGLVNDFVYEGQRNPYESYASQGSFTGRGALRQDEVKGLAAASGTGLGMHHGQTQSVQLGSGQSTGSQNQGQYPSMTHLANPFYYNMNPYGYGNQFYSPAFTSFVNPMYQAGGNQTPPHNSKPGMAGATGLGVSGNGSYSSGNPGHLHHSSGGFESDAGPAGTPTYHQPSPALAGDFSKGVYGGGQGFLGNMGASSANNRGPGGGSVGPTPTSETSFKGYGSAASTPAGLSGQDKASAAQGVRGTPNVTQGQQQFYQNTRFPAAQSQGYPQQQGQNDYYPYQRW